MFAWLSGLFSSTPTNLLDFLEDYLLHESIIGGHGFDKNRADFKKILEDIAAAANKQPHSFDYQTSISSHQSTFIEIVSDFYSVNDSRHPTFADKEVSIALIQHILNNPKIAITNTNPHYTFLAFVVKTGDTSLLSKALLDKRVTQELINHTYPSAEATILFKAADSPECLKMLLEDRSINRATINYRHENGASILDWCIHKNYKSLDVLFKQADLDMETINNSVTVCLAIKKLHNKTIDLFLNHRLFDVNFSDCILKLKNGNSLLHHAINVTNYDAVASLIKQCDLNKVDDLKESALHCAVRAKNKSICKQLVENGINVTLKNNNHLTAYDLAKMLHFEQGEELLKERTKNTAKKLSEYQNQRDQEANHPRRLKKLNQTSLKAAIDDIRFVADHGSPKETLKNLDQLVFEMAALSEKSGANEHAVNSLYAAAANLGHPTAKQMNIKQSPEGGKNNQKQDSLFPFWKTKMAKNHEKANTPTKACIWPHIIFP